LAAFLNLAIVKRKRVANGLGQGFWKNGVVGY